MVSVASSLSDKYSSMLSFMISLRSVVSARAVSILMRCTSSSAKFESRSSIACMASASLMGSSFREASCSMQNRSALPRMVSSSAAASFDTTIRTCASSAVRSASLAEAVFVSAAAPAFRELPALPAISSEDDMAAVSSDASAPFAASSSIRISLPDARRSSSAAASPTASVSCSAA